MDDKLPLLTRKIATTFLAFLGSVRRILGHNLLGLTTASGDSELGWSVELRHGTKQAVREHAEVV